MAYDSKAILKFCINGILDGKMSNGRGDLHPPPGKSSPFLNLSSKKHIYNHI